MSMFAKFNAQLVDAGNQEDTSTDPLASAASEDSFAEQREARNREHGMARRREDDQAAPVDGQDDDMTVGKTPTDNPLVDGEFGEDPKVKESGNDITVDADDTEVDFKEEGDDLLDDDLDTVERDEDDIEYIGDEMNMLIDSAVAIENFGLNPTALAIMKTTNLLSGTALESLGLESIGFSGGQEAESQMAIEALGEKIKEKAAAWSGKVLSVLKGAGEKILSVITGLGTKITSLVKTLGEKAWDKAKAAGSFVKAHPYATIAAVIAAAAAVAAIVSMVATGAPTIAGGGKIESLLVKVKDAIGKIKFPGGKITAALNSAGTKISMTFSKVVASKPVGAVVNAGTRAADAVSSAATTAGKAVVGATKPAYDAVAKGASKVGAPKAVAAVKGATSTALGWSQTAVKAIASQLTRVLDAVKHAWGAVAARAVKLGSGAADTVNSFAIKPASAAGDAARHAVTSHLLKNPKVGVKTALKVGEGAGFMAKAGYYAQLTALIGALFKLTRFVVVGGLRMVLGTFNALRGHASEPEAA